VAEVKKRGFAVFSPLNLLKMPIFFEWVDVKDDPVYLRKRI